MSSNASQSPSVTPDFVYLFQLGDYQHFLRPADQKAADHLRLAKVAVSHVDEARNLMTERGPFLVGEKQQRMDDVISDAEEALERVIKFLEPARIEQVSEESVRFNFKNAFVMQTNDPKGAATFGRLVTTNNKLRTVLHDLQHIEATAQLDNCEVRANTVVLSTPPASATGLQSNPSDLPAGRHGRRASRHAISSNASSISGLGIDETLSVESRSPISNTAHRLSLDAATLQPLSPASNDSTLPASALSVIHELEAASSTTSAEPTETPRPSEAGNLDDEEWMNMGKQSQVAAPTKTGNIDTENNVPLPPITTLRNDDVSSKRNAVETSDYVEFRQRNKEQRDSRPESAVQQRSVAVESPHSLSQPPGQEYDHREKVIDRLEGADLAQSDPTKVETAKALPSTSSTEPWPLEPQIERIKSPEPAGLPTNQTASASIPTRKSLPLISSPDIFENATKSVPRAGTHPTSLTTGTPISAQPPPETSQEASLTSPHRMQTSPQPQTPQDPLFYPQSDAILRRSSTKSYEIHIDPELARLPSLLRAGRKRTPDSRLPFVIPEEGMNHHAVLGIPASRSDGTMNSSDGNGQLRDGRQPISRQTYPLPIASEAGYESALNTAATSPQAAHSSRFRSMSDTTVPQIQVRPPTIPRKPVGYRRGTPTTTPNSTQRTPSRNEQGLATVERSAAISADSTGQTVLSSVSEQPHHVSNHSLSTQGLDVRTSSGKSMSRESSVSAEDFDEIRRQRQTQLNPLALNPTYPGIQDQQPRRSPSPIDGSISPPLTAQRLPSVSPPPHPTYSPPPIPVAPEQQIDYRSPAYQQSHYYVHRPLPTVLTDTTLDPAQQQSYNANPPLQLSEPQAVKSPTGSSSERRQIFDKVMRPVAPLRNNTEPANQLHHQMYDDVESGPRRASAQGIPNQELTRMQLLPTKTPDIPPQSSNQLLGMGVDRENATRTAPPVQGYGQSPWTSSDAPPRVASANSNVGNRKADKQLFGRQVLRQQPMPQPSDQLMAPQEQRYYAQQNRMSLPPTARNSASGQPMVNGEMRRTMLNSVIEGEVSSHMFSEPTSFETEVVKPAATPKKRASWLALQANKFKSSQK